MASTNLSNPKHNNPIVHLSGGIEKKGHVAHTREIVQSNDKIMEFLKRIDERKARTYHNQIVIARTGEVKDITQ
jgi:hypothetical protein